MNKVYLGGKIIEISDYRFFYNSKEHNSRVILKIKTLDSNCRNGTIIEFDVYDDMADKIYRYFEKEDIIFVEGQLTRNMRIEINKIEKMLIL